MAGPPYYTGVGSRRSPADVLAYMERVAAALAARGYALRSGHAAGADRAFERGAGGKAVIYLPWPGFGVTPYRDDPGCPVLGETVVPRRGVLHANHDRLTLMGLRPASCPDSHKMLHGRDVCQVVGHGAADILSDFVLCWAPVVAGTPVGGTATAMLFAKDLGVPVYNLGDEHGREWFEEEVLGGAP